MTVHLASSPESATQVTVAHQGPQLSVMNPELSKILALAMLSIVDNLGPHPVIRIQELTLEPVSMLTVIIRGTKLAELRHTWIPHSLLS